jgi:hypothetical protein
LDLKQNVFRTGFVEEKQCGRAQYVSSVHNAPGLVVALDVRSFKDSSSLFFCFQHAKQLSDNNQKQLLNNKKLILLIDLDQTLIHTTNKAPRPNEVKQVGCYCLIKK